MAEKRALEAAVAAALAQQAQLEEQLAATEPRAVESDAVASAARQNKTTAGSMWSYVGGACGCSSFNQPDSSEGPDPDIEWFDACPSLSV